MWKATGRAVAIKAGCLIMWNMYNYYTIGYYWQIDQNCCVYKA